MVKTLKNGVSVILMRKQWFMFETAYWYLLDGAVSSTNQRSGFEHRKPIKEKISERERDQKELWLPLRFLLAQMLQPYQEAQEEASEI